jgi:hypothetical protein
MKFEECQNLTIAMRIVGSLYRGHPNDNIGEAN